MIAPNLLDPAASGDFKTPMSPMSTSSNGINSCRYGCNSTGSAMRCTEAPTILRRLGPWDPGLFLTLCESKGNSLYHEVL